MSASTVICETQPLLAQANTASQTGKPSSASKSSQPGVGDELSTYRKVAIIGSLYFGIFLSAADGTLVTALLGRIASDLNALTKIQWITTAYLVAFAATQPLYGKLSDIFGRRQMLLLCNVSFGLGTLICGLSHSINLLIFGRVIAGIGGGGMLSLSAITLSDLVSLRQRGLFQGMANTLFATGASVGGYVGGIIADNWSWQIAFSCQVPLIIVSTSLIQTFLNLKKPAEGSVVAVRDEADLEAVRSHDVSHERQLKKSSFARIDMWGATTLVTSMILLMLGLSVGGTQYPWSSPAVYLPLTLSLASIVAFCYVELYCADEPILPLPLLRNPSVLGSSLGNFWMSMANYCYFFLFPLYVSATQNMAPPEIGSKLVYNFVAAAIGSFGAGFVMKVTGRYYSLGIIGGIAFLLGALIMHTSYSPRMGNEVIAPIMALFGLGYTMMLTVTLVALISSVPPELQAVTTSIQYAFRGVGSTVGVSIGASVLQNSLLSNLEEKVTGKNAASIIQETLRSTEVIWTLPVKQRLQVIAAYDASAQTVINFIVAFSICSLVSLIFIKEYKLHDKLNRSE